MKWKVIRRRGETGLVACSLCLRVHRGSAWLDAEDVITELRSYELERPPPLLPGVCSDCADAILERRARREETVAA